MQVGAIQPGQNVVVIDDVVATGERHVCGSNESSYHPILQGVPPQPQASSSPNWAERRSNTSSSSKYPP